MVTVNPILFLFWNYFCITRIFCTETLDEEKLLTMEQEHPVLVESKFFFFFKEGHYSIMNSVHRILIPRGKRSKSVSIETRNKL